MKLARVENRTRQDRHEFSDSLAMSLRFTLRQLEYLAAVGETGSIAAAAQRVNVASPSISAAIAQLEAVPGLPLFVRRPAQGLARTQAGREIVEQARAVLGGAARPSNAISHRMTIVCANYAGTGGDPTYSGAVLIVGPDAEVLAKAGSAAALPVTDLPEPDEQLIQTQIEDYRPVR